MSSERPRRRADRAAAMYADDAASQMLGITVSVDEPDRATATMVVRDDMVNGLGVCHGGLLFSLADTAMAFLSNVDMPDLHAALAAHAEIDWLRPVAAGQTVVARARAIAQPGRTTVNDVEIHADGELIAVFRGRTRTVNYD